MAAKRGKPPHRPTAESRKEVVALASFGVRQDQIALYLGLDAKTIRKHYRSELDTSMIRTNAKMARRLYSAAMEEGSVPAMIFWLKSQAGWREKQETEIAGKDGAPIRFTLSIAESDGTED